MTAVVLGATFSAPLFGEILFQENFRNYNRIAPNVNDGVNPYVDNDPIWARSANLVVEPEEGKSGPVFVKGIPLPKGNRFDLHFSFRLMNAVEPKPAKDRKPAVAADPAFFDIVFATQDGKKTQKIRVASDEIAGEKVRWIGNWIWQGFAIKANGRKAEVYYALDRAFEKIATVDLAADFATVNLFATEKRKFSFSDFVVATPGRLPDHPAEKHFASFRSLRQPIAGAITAGAEGAVVRLAPAPRAGVRFILGDAQNSAIELHWSDKARPDVHELAISRHGFNMKMPIRWLPIPKGTWTNLPDAVISAKGLFDQSVRPDMRTFCSSYDIEPQGVDIVREWKRLPPASGHPLDVDFVRLPDGGLRIFVDGSYLKTFGATKDKGVITNVVFRFGQGVKYLVKKDGLAKVDDSRFTVLDLSENPRAKAFARAKSSMAPGLRELEGVPMNVAAPIDSADVAICKQGKGNWALEVDEYLGRTPTLGFPAAIHYRLPAASYGKAHILFALDPDPRKEKILTVRVGHYAWNGSGGNMLGDAVLDLSDGRIPESFKKVGTVTKDGRKLPLYLATIQLGVGDILDILSGDRFDGISSGDYLDFEFLGKGWENFEQMDRTMKPHPDSDSAFNIFGVTLEKLPVKISFKQAQPGNVFTVDEKDRKTSFLVTALGDHAKGSVSWTAFDVDGKELFKGSEKYDIAKAGTTNVVDISLRQAKDPGYYTLRVVFNDTRSGCSLLHNATFAIMPPAGRKVGKWESPYATWWFNAHGSPGEAEIGVPIMRKAGIVRMSWNSVDFKKYPDLTNFRCAYIGLRWDNGKKRFRDGTIEIPDPKDPKGEKTIKKTIPGPEAAEYNLRKTLEKDSQRIDTVLLWHESGPGYGIPEELLGWPVPSGEKDKGLARTVDEAARIVRKLSKEFGRELHLQIGNSSASVGAAVRPLRAGANPDSYDRIGIETPSQVIPPERLSEVGLQGMVIAREAAEYYAKRPVALNGSWEFTYRCERDMGERQQAEWYMRDVLISLANNFSYISPGILFDCKNGYYNGLWGGSGMIRRGPFCYPKQAYVAYGVLTSVLDGVTFVRQIDTGSTTVYAIEFKRLDGKTATALWAARGEVVFEIDSAGKGTVTHMLGRTDPLAKGVSTVRGGTSPLYVVTDKPLGSVRIVDRAFAKDEAIAKAAKVAWAIDDASAVTLDPDPELDSGDFHGYLPILKPSDFTVKQVEDEEKGPCVEVALDLSKNEKTSRYITEYTTIRFKEPKAIPGKPAVIGVWVKGNSNWGQIRFEIEDARGEVFKNLTTGPSWGCDVMDWPGNLAVSFDGWGYVYTSLFPNSLMNDHSPGPVSEQWVSEGGDKKIDLPVKVRAITVGMNRHKLDLLDFKPSAPAIRLRDVGGTEDVAAR